MSIFGYYHTDITIPSEYFRPEVERPVEIEGGRLDFTYLFDDTLDNAAHRQMGRGIRVRASANTFKPDEPKNLKRYRTRGEEGRVADHPELQRALVEQD